MTLEQAAAAADAAQPPLPAAVPAIVPSALRPALAVPVAQAEPRVVLRFVMTRPMLPPKAGGVRPQAASAEEANDIRLLAWLRAHAREVPDQVMPLSTLFENIPLACALCSSTWKEARASFQASFERLERGGHLRLARRKARDVTTWTVQLVTGSRPHVPRGAGMVELHA